MISKSFEILIPNHFNDNPQSNNSELCAESHQSFDFEEEKKDYSIQTTSRHNFPKNWEFFVTYRLKSSGKSTHFLLSKTKLILLLRVYFH